VYCCHCLTCMLAVLPPSRSIDGAAMPRSSRDRAAMQLVTSDRGQEREQQRAAWPCAARKHPVEPLAFVWGPPRCRRRALHSQRLCSLRLTGGSYLVRAPGGPGNAWIRTRPPRAWRSGCSSGARVRLACPPSTPRACVHTSRPGWFSVFPSAPPNPQTSESLPALHLISECV
jgi:hypothetical protein